MSNKTWLRDDEWTDYAPCVGSKDFIRSPEVLGPQRTAAVVATCAACPVRPECITLNVAPVTDIKLKAKQPSHAVWTAGTWLPEGSTEAARRDLVTIKQALIDSLSSELADRPGHLL